MIVIKHFTASWCVPCKQLSPIMWEIVNKYPNIIYQSIDVDNDSNAAISMGVRSVPTVIFQKDGNEVQRVVGLQSKSYYEQIINSL